MNVWAPVRKPLIIVAGYIVAGLLASAAVSSYIALTPDIDRKGAAGMTAFGDGMFFLGALAVASIPPTGLALYWLRPHVLFWRSTVVVALLISSTALLALLAYLARGSSPGHWAMLSPIRILLAPGFGLAFLLCAVFAPTRRHRVGFFLAVLAEAIAFVTVASVWLLSAWAAR